MKQKLTFWIACVATAALLSGCPNLPGFGQKAPTAPSDLEATATSEAGVKLTWRDNSDNETAFMLEYGTRADFAGCATVLLGANVVSETVEGLTASTLYYFRMCALNGSLSSDHSAVATATTKEAPSALPSTPSAPSGLVATAFSDSEVDLTWTDESNNESAFVLECSTTRTFTSPSTVEVAADATSHTVSGLTAATPYYFRMRAKNAAGVSTPSNVVTATTQDPPLSVPNPPGDLTASDITHSQVRLSWSDNSDNETAFVLEYSESDDFATSTDITIPADGTSRTVTELDADTTYHVRVCAKNSAGSSAYSSAVSIQTDDPPITIPAKPTNLEATAASDSQVDLTWKDNADDEEQVTVQWSTSDDFTSSANVVVATDVESYSVTGLAEETEYFFRVRAGNSAGDSNWSDQASATTGAVPAGTFAITYGARFTRSRDVTLRSTITGASEMRFQNAGAVWSAWQNYSPTVAWVLVDRDGTRTVHAEYRTDLGVTVSKTDTIVLDRKAPVVRSVTLNNGAAYTNARNVKVTTSVDDAAYMCFSTDSSSWSGWYSYRSDMWWTLPSQAGTRRVYVKFKDAAGNISDVASDSIFYDPTPPSISSFYIEGSPNTANTYTTSVTLRMSVSGATQMRFSNDNRNWSSWINYSSQKSWTIVGRENAYSYVYAQFRDAAGNVSSRGDSIYYDAVRRLRITAKYFYCVHDSDTGSGELKWYFQGYYRDGSGTMRYFDVHNQTTEVSMDDGDTYNFADRSVVISLPRTPTASYTLEFYIREMDSGNPDDRSPVANRTYGYDQWGVGNTVHIYAGGSSGPRGLMYYQVTRVD